MCYDPPSCSWELKNAKYEKKNLKNQSYQKLNIKNGHPVARHLRSIAIAQRANYEAQAHLATHLWDANDVANPNLK